MQAQRHQTIPQRMSAAVFAQHQRADTDAYVFWLHDFVGCAVLQHAVLMNAGFMRKSVVAHNGFVARHRHAGERGEQAAGRLQTTCINVGRDREQA